MRITCAIHSLDGGGAERVMAGLATRLSTAHAVSLLTLDAGQHDRYRCGDNVSRIALNLMSESHSVMQAIASNRRRVAAIRAAVESTSPDVVLSFCDKMNILTLAACRSLAVPVVISERSQPAHQKLGPLWSTLRRWHYPRAAACVVQTAAAADAVAQWTSAPISIIAAAIDPPPAGLAARDPDQRPKTLVSLGRLSAEKQVDRLITAFAQLPDSLSQWTLQICGDGAQRDALARQIAGLRLGSRVQLCGWVSDVGAVFRDAGAFALTSRYEGFPNALLEAMAAGVPSLAVDCESGPREIIRDGENGLLVPQDDPAALSAGLQRLLTDINLRRRFASEAPGVLQRFGWEAFVRAYTHVLQSVTA